MVLIVQLDSAQVVQVGLAVLILLLGPLGIHTEPAQKTTVNTNKQLRETLGWLVDWLFGFNPTTQGIPKLLLYSSLQFTDLLAAVWTTRLPIDLKLE